jgi:RND family efflux transporter MFP subunit
MSRTAQVHRVWKRLMVIATPLLLAIVNVSGCDEKNVEHPHAIQPVLISTVQNEQGSYQREFNGLIAARYEAKQSFRVTGKVEKRLVDIGQMVTKGETLALLDMTDYELALKATLNQYQAAKVDAEQAQIDAERFGRLVKQQAVSLADYQQQKARSEAANALEKQMYRQVELARNKVNYSSLISEFNGVISELNFEVGQVVSAGQAVVTISDMRQLEVVVDLPEEIAADIKSYGLSARFWNDDTVVFSLTLRELSPVAAAKSRTFRARLSFDFIKPEQMDPLQLGKTMKVYLSINDQQSASILPASALLNTGETPLVFVVNSDSTLIEKQVEVIRYTNKSALVQGLDDGDRIVSAGIHKLLAGMEVVVIDRTHSGLDLAMPTVQKQAVQSMELSK